MAGFKNQAALRGWMIDRLCSALNIEPTDVDPDEPFSRYALDSVDAVTLVMELEEALGIELPPTLLWDYPTVNRCVAFLSVNLPQ
ncbi:acyl carrier protein [Bradyrhizobium sp. GCM10023182]|uniref:acyl carrier protein n=1 Tax=Bradyrhizobium TaxID=374 RepID=UPI00361EB346